MAVIKGTADTYIEMFKAVHNALVGNGWTVENYVNFDLDQHLTEPQLQKKSDDSMRWKTVIYKGRGFSEANSPYIMLKYIFDNNRKYYAILADTMMSYDKVNDKKISPLDKTYFISFDYQTVSYHIVVNSRRIILNVRQNVKSQDMYIGFFLPLCKPTEYAYPMYISASQHRPDTEMAYTQFNHKNIDIYLNQSFIGQWDRGVHSSSRTQGYLCTPDNNWLAVTMNIGMSAELVVRTEIYGSTKHGQPYRTSSSSENSDNNYENFIRSFVVEDNINCLERIYLAISKDTYTPHTLGSLDGVYLLYGLQQPDSIITLSDTSKYRIFATNNLKFDFYALNEVEI